MSFLPIKNSKILPIEVCSSILKIPIFCPFQELSYHFCGFYQCNESQISVFGSYCQCHNSWCWINLPFRSDLVSLAECWIGWRLREFHYHSSSSISSCLPIGLFPPQKFNQASDCRSKLFLKVSWGYSLLLISCCWLLKDQSSCTSHNCSRLFFHWPFFWAFYLTRDPCS